MQFTEGSFCHIYNRGNNKGTLFFEERNYDFFMQKVKKYISANADLLGWCLMSNHFHFLVQANAESTRTVKESPIKINALTEGIRMLLSSYTKGIQKQESMTGNLFQQKTKFKCVDDYLHTAFHYIHQNPFKARLVRRPEDWKWSSLREYLGMASEKICKKKIARLYLDLGKERLMEDSYLEIPGDMIKAVL